MHGQQNIKKVQEG